MVTPAEGVLECCGVLWCVAPSRISGGATTLGFAILGRSCWERKCAFGVASVNLVSQSFAQCSILCTSHHFVNALYRTLLTQLPITPSFQYNICCHCRFNHGLCFLSIVSRLRACFTHPYLRHADTSNAESEPPCGDLSISLSTNDTNRPPRSTYASSSFHVYHWRINYQWALRHDGCPHDSALHRCSRCWNSRHKMSRNQPHCCVQCTKKSFIE